MPCLITRHEDTQVLEQVAAPNGQPSLLYEQIRSVLSDNYQPDSYVQSALDQHLIVNDSPAEVALALWSKIYTPPFKEWFGDWTDHTFGSPEWLDKNGEPLVTVLPDGRFQMAADKTYVNLETIPEGLVYDLGARPILPAPFAVLPQGPLVKRAYTQWQQALKADDPTLIALSDEQEDGTIRVQQVLRKSPSLERVPDRAKLQDITDRMQAIFPQLQCRIITEDELASFDFGMTDPRRDRITSFVQQGTVYLVEGRITAAGTIEEWLHPFVHALQSSSPELFQNILQEALNHYPHLNRLVQAMYTQDQGFTDADRANELVTKTLTDGLYRRIWEAAPAGDYTLRELLRQFFAFLQDTFRQLTGRKKLYVGEIPSNTTLDELLTLLEEGLQVDIGPLNHRVYFNLKEDKLEVYNRILAGANEVQREILEKLALNNAVFIEDTHAYIRADTGVPFTSVTQRIKGQLDESDPYAIHRAFGKEFDFIMNSIALGHSLPTIAAQLQLIKPDVVQPFYDHLRIYLAGATSNGAIIVPQLVLADEASMVAGTLDLLLIDPQGNMDIIDLKVSKSTVLGKGYNKPWPIDQAPSVLIGRSLSTRQQHGLQQHAYKKLIELTGTPVRSVKTLHFRITITGKQVTGFDPEGLIDHTTTNYSKELDLVIPTPLPAPKTFTTLLQAQALPENAPVVQRIQEVVEGFQQTLRARLAYFENINTSTTGKTTASPTYLAELAELINTIDEEMQKGSPAGAFYQIIKFINQDLKRKTDQVTGTTVAKEKLIDFLLESEKDIHVYMELLQVPKLQLNNVTLSKLAKEALNYADSLQTVIDVELKSFVKEFVRSHSSRSFTEEELEQLLQEAKDISQADYLLGDMATSTDTLLAVLDKVYKSKLQGVYDFTDDLAQEITRLGNQLAELNGGKPDYNFMIQRNAEGQPTGYYVRKISSDYWKKLRGLKEPLQDDDGQALKYREVYNIDTAAPEDLAYNLKLMDGKKAYRAFLQPEQVDSAGNLQDGTYHRYKADFKTIRDQYEFLHVEMLNGEVLYHEWRKHSHVTELDYKRYLATYYTPEITYLSPVKEEVGHNQYEYMGRVVERSSRFVKSEFAEPKEKASTGESLVDPRYEQLMNAATPLEQVQKAYYEAWTKRYADQLDKLPSEVRRSMAGRLPLVEDRLTGTLKTKSPGMLKGMLKGLRNLNPFDLKVYSHNVLTNEEGEIEHQVPIFYVGDFQQQTTIDRLETAIRELGEQLRTKAITYMAYKAQLAKVKQSLSIEKGKITRDQLSLDMTTNLVEFGKMAETYLVMSAFESTVEAVQRVAAERLYQKENAAGIITSSSTQEPAKFRGDNSLVLKRLEKWKEMVFYRTSQPFQSRFGQIARKMMQYMSLKNVALNPFGQVNNYLMGKINNAIENAGGIYWDRPALLRATRLYNTDFLPGLVARRSAKLLSKGDYYEIDKPFSKYEALASRFRMMRRLESADLGQGLQDRALDMAYVMQESAEFNIQTKTGMAILMTRTLKHATTQEEIPIFDAFDYDSKTRQLTLKEGFELPDATRHDITNYIYEVNKQIHGNYAYEDRMVIQQHALGELAAQYHKWVYPAFKTRYSKGHFNEILGDIEGRYATVWNYMVYAWDLKNASDAWNLLTPRQQANLYKASADLAFMLLTVVLFHLFMTIGDGIDEEDEHTKKMVNWMTSQSDRLYDEITTGIVILGTQQQYQLLKSPLALLGFAKDGLEVMAEALKAPFPPYDDLYFKSGIHKGELRLKKELMDVIPVLNLFNRWDSYETVKQFYIR